MTKKDKQALSDFKKYLSALYQNGGYPCCNGIERNESHEHQLGAKHLADSIQRCAGDLLKKHYGFDYVEGLGRQYWDQKGHEIGTDAEENLKDILSKVDKIMETLGIKL